MLSPGRTSASSPLVIRASALPPFLDTERMACMCRKVMGSEAESRRASVNTSWKCVAARTFGQLAPRSRSSFRTPQKRPAPSYSEKSKARRRGETVAVSQKPKQAKIRAQACGDGSFSEFVEYEQRTGGAVAQSEGHCQVGAVR